jgi:hypothetical protein
MNMKRLSILVLGTLLLLLGTASIATATRAQDSHALVRFHAVGGSGVSGFALLRQLPQGGTRINVVAFGLKAGNPYLSLYYDNHVCDLEPYSAEDVIGGIYRANRVGVGVTQGNADDDLDEINSVSVRRAGDFSLVACANVHP